MAEVHVEEHSSQMKRPQQRIVVVVLAFVIPVDGIVMIASCATGGMKLDKTGSDASAAAVAERLKPVGTVVIGAAPVPATSAPGAATTVKSASAEVVKSTAASGPAAGKKLYDTVCMVCHAAGSAGAPKTGDKAAWKARIATGKNALYNSALHGKNAMPAKGGLASASDADVKAAVDYLVGLAK